jgi:subtilisin family serine protease
MMNVKHLLAMGAAIVSVALQSIPAVAQELAGTGNGGAVVSKLRHLRSAIPNQYIVKFRDEISKKEIRQVVQELTSRNRRVLRLYSNILNGFAIRLTEQQAQELSQDERVEYVEEDAKMSVNQVALTPCGTAAKDGHIPKCVSQQASPDYLDRLNQNTSSLDGVYTQSGTGKNINVYVMDTGVLTTHTDFQGRATSVYDATKLNDGNSSKDCNGHGTFVAGLIGGSVYGIAKEANIRSVRVLDCTGAGSTSNIIAAIDWITANAPRPSVVNMSFGGAKDTSLQNAVQNAIKLNYVFVVAAGNDNVDVSGVSPASVAPAYTVGSRDTEENRAAFSNYGGSVDYYLPGVNIYSVFNTSTTSQAIGSGTSFSAPIVAGMFAVQLEWDSDPKKAASAVANLLKSAKLDKAPNNPSSSSPQGRPGQRQTDSGKGDLKSFGTPFIY